MSAGSLSDEIITTGDEPTLTEAMHASKEECDILYSAILEEQESLDSKQAWEEDRNPKYQPLPSHVVLKIKRNSDATIQRFKARVVAGGNCQTYGEDYLETYAPVVSFPTVRLFVYLAVTRKMIVIQLDLKTAFLNGELKENVWIISPRRIPGLKAKCYRLTK